MRAERLGSYSIAATTAGIPALSRLKSIMRYAFFAPPPINRDVMRPRLLRPPVRFLVSTSDFSGRCLVMSSRETTVWKRRVGAVGLSVLIGMFDLREVRHFLAGLQRDIGLFPVRPVSGEAAAAAQLAVERGGAHFLHLNLKQLLDRGLDLGFVGVERDFETQRPLVVLLGYAFFGDQRPPDDLVNRHFASASESLRAAASDISRLWCPST